MSRYSSLTLTTSFPECPDDPSGHFVLSEVRRRARHGAHRVLAPGPTGVEARPGVDAGGSIEVERLGGVRAFGWPGVMARLSEDPRVALPAAALVRRMRSRMRELDARELVAHWLLPCGLLALEDGRRSTLWAHGSDVRLLRRSRLATHAFVALAVRRPAHVVFVAEHLRDALLEGLPPELARALKERSSIEPAPIELDVSPREVDLPEGDFVVWVGRFIRSKDPAMAVRIAERHRVRLVMLGDGPIAVPSSTFVTHLGQRPRPEALAIIARSCALLSTSKEEGHSTVVREARSLGKPIFARRTRGIEDAEHTKVFETEAALGQALESFLRRSA